MSIQYSTQVNSVNDLFSVRAKHNDIFQTLGYSTKGVGGNLYRYDAGSSATIDGGFVLPGVGGTLSFSGTTFNGTVGTGRFIAIDQTVADPIKFGASGNGTSDDTKAVQRAIDTGRTVSSSDEFVMSVGALQLSSVGQRITRLRLKRKASTAGTVLLVSGTECNIDEIEVDGNGSAQSPANDAARYGYYGIRINANDVKVSRCYVHDEVGLSIASTAGSRLSIVDNVIESAGKAGVFLSDTVTDLTDCTVERNLISTSYTSCFGIAIYGNNDLVTSRAKSCVVANNVVRGLTTGNAPSESSGINVRCTLMSITGNRVYGFQLGISADATNFSSITGNSVESSETYGIEWQGRCNTISGNTVVGGTYAIVSSSCSDPAYFTNDRNSISGNTLSGFVTTGVYLATPTLITSWSTGQVVAIGNLRVNAGRVFRATTAGTTGATAPTHYEGSVSDGAVTWRYVSSAGGEQTITGNTIDASLAGSAITLKGEGNRGSLISGNELIGPGKSTASSRAIRLDDVRSEINISGNTIRGFERPVMVYSPSAIAWTRIHATGNNAAADGFAPQLFLALEGLATFGDGCVSAFNSSGQERYGLWIGYDLSTNRIIQCSQVAANPEGNVVAGIGSLFLNRSGSSGTTLYVKESGTGNTGWVGIKTPLSGTGSPEGVVTAPIGSLYTRTDGAAGTTLYVKESGTGNTGWVAK